MRGNGIDAEVLPPFTIYDADFALYLADASGNPGSSAVFLGGRLEELSPEVTYTNTRIDRHGDAYGRNYHSDEEHRFTVKNLWIMNRASRSTPQVRRNQQYVFVVRWYDARSGAWALRAYYGVTADSQALVLEDQVFHQTVSFRARYMAPERTGLTLPPTLVPVTTGFLSYVTATEVTPLYSYDFTTNLFSLIDPALLAGRAAIVTDSSKWELQIGGSAALRATSTGILVKELTVIGGTFPLGIVQGASAAVYPRMEFYIGQMRLAAVTKAGELAVPDISEIAAEPGLGAEQFFRIPVNGAWAASLTQGLFYAKDFSESLP